MAKNVCRKCGIKGSVVHVGEGVFHCNDCGSDWREPKSLAKRLAQVTAPAEPEDGEE